jgi:hypothetical protein
MCAVPVLVMRSISLMTAELVIVDDMSNPSLDKSYRKTYVTTLLPEPAMTFQVIYYTQYMQGQENTRFPWIQNNDPDCFQSLNVELSMNQVVVPS